MMQQATYNGNRTIQVGSARVYEPEDFDQAIHLAANDALPLDTLITERYPLTKLQDAFDEIASGAEVMKILVDTQADG